MESKRFLRLAWITCIGMLIVLLAGALVTNTGSGLGCGNDWPLCNGKFIPAKTVESSIEYSHRMISGLEGLLVLAVYFFTWNYYRKNKEKYKEPHFYASMALAFTIIQAFMGAAAVKWPQTPAVMAIHFGISIIAFASTMLLVMWVYRARSGKTTASAPRGIWHVIWPIATYCYVVIYSGAFIRHTKSTGGCLDWPLCNGELIPPLTGATGAVFIHRLGAVALTIVLVFLYFYIRKAYGSVDSDGMIKSARWILYLVVAQGLSGAWLTFTIGNENWFLFTSLFHNVIVTIVFGLLSDILVRSYWYRQKN